MDNLGISESNATLDAALQSLESGVPFPLTGPETKYWSERCVEVPWAASLLTSPGRLLDVGWSMSPPEWLGVLLATVERGAELTGIDIIDPERVRSRYPKELLQKFFAIPVRVESILEAEAQNDPFDTITCISTLEHIGFDIAAPPEEIGTAFMRAATVEDAVSERDPSTDGRFLDAAVRLLRNGGSLLLSVPAGKGGPILHQDSLGLFTHQYEYDPSSWKSLLSDPRFEVKNENYFSHDPGEGWQEVSSCEDLAHQTSALKPFATGCAMARFVKI